MYVAVTAYALLAVRGTFDHRPASSDEPANQVYLGSQGHRIAGRVYGWRPAGPQILQTPRPLLVVLHGDAPFHNPGYQNAFALQVAKAAQGSTEVSVLRPGYSDPFGMKSDGDRGFAVGENYTPAVVADIAEAIRQMRSDWKVSGVVLVGHSGGAAIAANVAALNPGLVDRLFLVGCPCDVPAFRKHMARARRDPMWLVPVHSLSPMDTLDQMQKGIIITAISGADDPVTLPEYARAYVDKAKSRGLDATMITLPGEGHEILLNRRVIDVVAEAVRETFPVAPPHGGALRSAPCGPY